MLKQLQAVFRKYSRFWWIVAGAAWQTAFINRWSNGLFFLGKVVRFATMLLFLWLLTQNAQQIGDYDINHIVIFFLTYHILDLCAQIVFRHVYSFGQDIQSGFFDFYLAQPINALFRALAGWPDLNDTLFLIPTLLVSGWIIAALDITITVQNAVIYGLMLFNSGLIITALHIFVVSAAILVVDVSGLVWLLRDVTRLGQFPVTVYVAPLRFVLLFLVPVGVMITVPAEVLIGNNPTVNLLAATGIGIGFFIASLFTWQIALQKYSSASS